MKRFLFFFLATFLFACQSKNVSIEAQTTNTKAEKPTSSIQKLPPQQFATQLQQHPNAVILDVRTPTEFADGYIDGAININVLEDDFASNVNAQIQLNQTIFVYCKAGGRSARAANVLQEMGYAKIYDLYGGYTDWRKAATTTLPDSLKRNTH
ncbi:MAG: rhodanese-like domain-containing protein [Bacteroidota bacterium]